MVSRERITDEDIERLSIKTFDDNTEIRFKLGSGLRNNMRDYYQVAYCVDGYACSFNDLEIFKYANGLSNIIGKESFVHTIYKIYNICSWENLQHEIDKVQGFEMLRKEDITNDAKLDMMKYDRRLIEEMRSDIQNKMTKIKVIEDLGHESKGCHSGRKLNPEKFFYYIYALFHSEDIYLIYGSKPSKYRRRLKMAGMLYSVYNICSVEEAAKMFHDETNEKDVENKLHIIYRYDPSQMDIAEAWKQ